MIQILAAQGGFDPVVIIMWVAIGLIFWFFIMRPQKKRQKEEQEMRNAVDVGDEITTIGGICGKIIIVKEDKLVIETGVDRTKMTITRWAVQQNNTASERVAAERAAAKEAAEKAKDEKKKAKENKDVL